MSDKYNKKGIKIASLDELKKAFESAKIKDDILLPPGFQKSKSKSKYTRIKRAGVPVEDAKHSVEFWNKYDQVIYITKAHADKLLSSPHVPKALKKVIMFNLDQFKKDTFEGESIPLNITEIMEHDVFGHVLNNPIAGEEDAD